MMGTMTEYGSEIFGIKEGYMKKALKKMIGLLVAAGFSITVIFSLSMTDAFAASVQPVKKQETEKQLASDQNQKLSDALKAKIISILSKYHPSSLTAEDAKAINLAFKEAGILQGAAQQEAIKAAGFDPQKISALAPPPDKDKQGNQTIAKNNISIEQAISDDAQLKTIAFSGLAFLTGDFCSNTFFPPGKVSDFFGFQYMRDIMPNGFGHNTEFAGRVADSVLSILTREQVQALVALANTQADQIEAFGYKRFALIKAFQQLLDNDLPDRTKGLNKSAVIEFTGDLYEIDAEISYGQAKVMGGILAGFTNVQKTKMGQLLITLKALFQKAGAGGTIRSEDWPTATKVDLSGIIANDGHVLVSTYATNLFSWYLGSLEGDTYFCPERHGTYFGSFYMKDIPPITSDEGISIDTNLTAEMGQAFLDALSTTQKTYITNLVDIQKTDLNNIVAARKAISEKLRLFIKGSSANQNEVYHLLRQYGEYEGEMIYYYATHFATVGNTLTKTQTDSLMGLRKGYYSRFPDYQENSDIYDCSGAWLYASKVGMPDVIDTDFLFGSGEK